ncbi:MAG TPA: PP0621 family protein [Burkholderiales bacterium]|nr:PP0621 family protein [Burkholderiales bacterium]
MAKFLLVIAVFIVVYLLLRNVANKPGAASARDTASNGSAAKKGASKLAEDMVRCGICGVHLPTSEAITSRGDFFCSKEHLQLAVRQRDSH